MRGIYQSPVDSPHKGSVVWKVIPCGDVIMCTLGGFEIVEVDTVVLLYCSCRLQNQKYFFNPMFVFLKWKTNIIFNEKMLLHVLTATHHLL